MRIVVDGPARICQRQCSEPTDVCRLDRTAPPSAWRRRQSAVYDRSPWRAWACLKMPFAMASTCRVRAVRPSGNPRRPGCARGGGWLGPGVFLWDHVVSGSLPIADTWATLGAIAQATHHLLLGPMVTPLPRRRPWVVAREASTVSRLSGGRLVLGPGLGSDESGDFSRFGEPTDAPRRAEMLTEGLGIVRAMWSGQSLQHDGRHYQVSLDEGAAEPHRIPVGWPGPPSGNPRVLRRAATCDGIFHNPGHLPSPRGHRRAARRDPPRLFPADLWVRRGARRECESWPGMEPTHVDLKALAAAGMTWWMESLIHFDPLDLSLKIVDAGPPRV